MKYNNNNKKKKEFERINLLIRYLSFIFFCFRSESILHSFNNKMYFVSMKHIEGMRRKGKTEEKKLYNRRKIAISVLYQSISSLIIIIRCFIYIYIRKKTTQKSHK